MTLSRPVSCLKQYLEPECVAIRCKSSHSPYLKVLYPLTVSRHDSEACLRQTNYGYQPTNYVDSLVKYQDTRKVVYPLLCSSPNLSQTNSNFVFLIISEKCQFFRIPEKTVAMTLVLLDAEIFCSGISVLSKFPTAPNASDRLKMICTVCINDRRFD